jgi:hypothetical protein
VSRAELSYLLPLFELTEAMVGDEEQENVSFGLGEPAQSSQLTGDDADMGGFYVSYAVNGAIAAALDHAITLKLLVTKAGAVTNAAPWTLLRGVLEPASVAAWIIVGSRRAIRRERALRFWHHDMTERAKWEADTGHVVNPPGKDGRTRAGEIVQIAKTLSLRENQVVTPLSYSDAVAHAGEAAGWPRPKARALWRECSGFAHGRGWPLGHRATFDHVIPVRGGHSIGFMLAEEHHEKGAELTYAVLTRALSGYASASAEATSEEV